MILRTDELTVRYGARDALTNLTVAMREGVVGLLGPNGAGKSTLIKTLLGLLRPSAGRAEVLGIPVDRDPLALRLRTGYMPERNSYLPELTAVEMVALAGELGGIPRRAVLERAHESLRFAGLGEARYRQVDGFSTGMLQRTKLATALVHDPDLLLLDEPTSGLDPAGRREMLDLIRDLSRRKKISIVLSTHLLHDVEAVCDSVTLLNRGQLALYGDIAVLKRAPTAAYEVRVREDQPGAFASALRARGLSLTEGIDGVVTVPLSDSDPRLLFEVARASGAQIRHLRRFETKLEDLFLAALKGPLTPSVSTRGGQE